MADCLTQELLECYVAGTCSQDQTRAVETHLSRCDNCRRRTDSARRNMADPNAPLPPDSGQEPPAKDDKESHIKEGDFPTVSIIDSSVTAYASRGIDPDLASTIEGYELLDRSAGRWSGGRI